MCPWSFASSNLVRHPEPWWRLVLGGARTVMQGRSSGRVKLAGFLGTTTIHPFGGGMKKFIITILATVLITGSVVTLSAASAQANHNCNTFTFTRSDADTMLMSSSVLKMHFSPRLFISNAENHCERAVVFVSDGWKFEPNGCGTVFAVRVDTDPDRMLASPTVICGGQAKRLYCCLPRSAIIKMFWTRTPWNASDPPIGTVRY